MDNLLDKCPFSVLSPAVKGNDFNGLNVVRAAGLEPARPFGLEILSLVRLPFRQARTALMQHAGERSRFLSTSVPLQAVLCVHRE